jgi:hypothetical protein
MPLTGAIDPYQQHLLASALANVLQELGLAAHPLPQLLLQPLATVAVHHGVLVPVAAWQPLLQRLPQLPDSSELSAAVLHLLPGQEFVSTSQTYAQQVWAAGGPAAAVEALAALLQLAAAGPTSKATGADLAALEQVLLWASEELAAAGRTEQQLELLSAVGAAAGQRSTAAASSSGLAALQQLMGSAMLARQPWSSATASSILAASTLPGSCLAEEACQQALMELAVQQALRAGDAKWLQRALPVRLGNKGYLPSTAASQALIQLLPDLMLQMVGDVGHSEQQAAQLLDQLLQGASAARSAPAQVRLLEAAAAKSVQLKSSTAAAVFDAAVAAADISLACATCRAVLAGSTPLNPAMAHWMVGDTEWQSTQSTEAA